MKERSQHLLSEAGENIDYMRSDLRNLSRYIADLEALVEAYCTFASNAKLSVPGDKATKSKLLKRTQKVIGPPPDKQPGLLLPKCPPWR